MLLVHFVFKFLHFFISVDTVAVYCAVNVPTMMCPSLSFELISRYACAAYALMCYKLEAAVAAVDRKSGNRELISCLVTDQKLTIYTCAKYLFAFIIIIFKLSIIKSNSNSLSTNIYTCIHTYRQT